MIGARSFAMSALDALAPAGVNAGVARLRRARADFSPFTAQCLQGDAAGAALLRLAQDMVQATPFQSDFWFAQWRKAFAGSQRTLLLMIVRRRGEDQPVIALPLSLQTEGRLRVIGFADAGVSDYNAPLMRADLVVQPEEQEALLECIQRALPAADILLFDKMPHFICGQTNPLAQSPLAHESRLNGNIVQVGEIFDDYIRGFHRKYRKEVGREKRVFESFAGARFVAARTLDEALLIMDALEHIQSARMAMLHRDYILNETEKRDFYRAMLADGLADGSVSLTALKVGNEVIAALYCVNREGHCAMVRIAQAGGPWSVCSPGRLIILETMRWLHAHGYRLFDFTIGAYDYKRRLGAEPVALARVMVALSLRGQMAVAQDALGRRLRRSALLRRFVQIWRDRAPVQD